MNITREQAADMVGGRVLEDAEADHAGPLRPGGRALRARRDHPRRHQVRAGPRPRGRAGAGRRGRDARLVAPVAGRPVGARPEPALLRQAVPARLARRDRLGPCLPSAAAPRRGRRGDPGAVPGGPRTHHGGARVTQVVVTVMPKAGVLDPQGQAVAGALAQLGFGGVGEVRIGKRIELAIDGDDPAGQAREMCEKLLANALIEDYSGGGARVTTTVAVVRFPGSLDHDSAARAVEGLGARAVEAWHADPELPAGTDAVLIPGRLLLRRPPALRRHRQPRARDGGGAPPRRGRRAGSSASATASRCSARRACCPGRCGATRPSRSSAARWSWRWPTTARRGRGAAERRDDLDPDQEQRGRLVRRPLDGAGGAALPRRTCSARPTGSPASRAPTAT